MLFYRVTYQAILYYVILRYITAPRPVGAPIPGQACMRGWWTTVGDLIEFSRVAETTSRASMYWHMRNTEGYGFIEFEISKSTISTVFCQPLMVGPLGEQESGRGPRCPVRDRTGARVVRPRENLEQKPGSGSIP